MDRELRAAERSGDPLAALRARRRAGELSLEQLKVAASLGHGAALELCPGVELVDWQEVGSRLDIVAKAAGLVGETLPARVAADWAERALPAWESTHRGNAKPRRAIIAARAWADCPCEDHKAAALAASTAVERSMRQPGETSANAFESAWAASLAAKAAGASDAVDSSVCASKLAEDAIDGWSAERADDSIPTSFEAESEWQRLRLAAYVLGLAEANQDPAA